MIIVTGGAGFIGSNIVKSLNEKGIDDILVVDHVTNVEKFQNLSDLNISDYMDRDEFYQYIKNGRSIGNISVVFHNGACSDTTETDIKFMLHNNFTYSKELYHFCQKYQAQYIYASSASVYGNKLTFSAVTTYAEEKTKVLPLSIYAYSKLLFDNYILRRKSSVEIQCVGLRYFNVYGHREKHKGHMSSVIWQFYRQYTHYQQVKLFQGSGGYHDGEQLRDFVSVNDIINVNLFLFENSEISGIFDVGTGQCQSFNQVAISVINNCRKKIGKKPVSFEEALKNEEIQYIPIPESLKGYYQSYTCADLGKLRSVGYQKSFYDMQTGIAEYLCNHPTPFGS